MLRGELAEILGIRDQRLPNPVMQIMSTTAHGGTIARGHIVQAQGDSQVAPPEWQIRLVRWPVLDGVYGEGLLIEPLVADRVRLNVVVIPDADQTPEQIAGLVPGVPETLQYAYWRSRVAES